MQTLLILALLSAPNEWHHKEPFATLIQPASFGATVAGIWSEVKADGVTQLHCVFDPETRCRPLELRTGTIEEFDADDVALDVPLPLDVPKDERVTLRSQGGHVRLLDEIAPDVFEWEWTPGYHELTSPEKALLTSWVVLTWPGAVPTAMTGIKGELADGSYRAKSAWVKAGTRAQYLAAIKTGGVRARNGSE